MRNTSGGRRRCWWPRRKGHAPAPLAAGAGADGTQAAVGAVQLAIALLTASLDSPQLEAWAVQAMIPRDAEGLGDFMAGLHVVSGMLLHELQEATGESAAATLQRLAILAETRPGTTPAG